MLKYGELPRCQGKILEGGDGYDGMYQVFQFCVPGHAGQSFPQNISLKGGPGPPIRAHGCEERPLVAM